MSLILLRRDWRAGELRLLLVALAVAVAAMSTVGFFIDRLGNALSSQATQLLGGDVVVSSDHPIPPAWIEEAHRRGLAECADRELPEHGAGGCRSKAGCLAGQPARVGQGGVGREYPLRGGL